MNMLVDETLLGIFREILGFGYSEAEWDEIPSDDMFQDGAYCGGFESSENAFTFSVCRDDGEYWFQVTLAEVEAIVAGRMTEVEIRPAEK